jgi:transketolase
MDGNNLEEIGAAIKAAKADLTRPSLVKINTRIGYGSPKEGMASAHGEPLGTDNIKALREKLGWPSETAFEVPEQIYDHYKAITAELAKEEEKWNSLFADYSRQYPEMKKLWDQYYDLNPAADLLDNEDFWAYEDKADATRSISGKIINRIKNYLPNLIGGSADLAPSTKTYMSDEGEFNTGNYSGRNLRFGVRELAMAGIGNGLMLHGGLRAYVSTFFVFSDFMKPMMRLAALMEAPLTYVLTHDSIGVGEDGPTHEPIEQLAMLRSTPNLTVFRPADATECIAAWYYAVTSRKTPTALVLTRQNVPPLKGSSKEALKGAYIISDSKKAAPDAIIIASGSEVELGFKAQELLSNEGIDVRVVSMPSMDVFEKQSDEYKESILPKSVRARVAVEALSDFGWGKYVGLDGTTVTMKGFGASAPAKVLFAKYGFTPENVANAVKSIL